MPPARRIHTGNPPIQGDKWLCAVFQCDRGLRSGGWMSRGGGLCAIKRLSESIYPLYRALVLHRGQ
eukprot:scaffold66489_cov34-Tisochrysis_lutea.AAC.1